MAYCIAHKASRTGRLLNLPCLFPSAWRDDLCNETVAVLLFSPRRVELLDPPTSVPFPMSVPFIIVTPSADSVPLSGWLDSVELRLIVAFIDTSLSITGVIDQGALTKRPNLD